MTQVVKTVQTKRYCCVTSSLVVEFNLVEIQVFFAVVRGYSYWH